jgi:hypothetical protein
VVDSLLVLGLKPVIVQTPVSVVEHCLVEQARTR